MHQSPRKFLSSCNRRSDGLVVVRIELKWLKGTAIHYEDILTSSRSAQEAASTVQTLLHAHARVTAKWFVGRERWDSGVKRYRVSFSSEHTDCDERLAQL